MGGSVTTSDGTLASVPPTHLSVRCPHHNSDCALPCSELSHDSPVPSGQSRNLVSGVTQWSSRVCSALARSTPIAHTLGGVLTPHSPQILPHPKAQPASPVHVSLLRTCRPPRAGKVWGIWVPIFAQLWGRLQPWGTLSTPAEDRAMLVFLSLWGDVPFESLLGAGLCPSPLCRRGPERLQRAPRLCFEDVCEPGRWV